MLPVRVVLVEDFSWKLWNGFRLPPPDAFSLRSRDIIKVFIVTPAHCCKEFFLRPSCRVKSIVLIWFRMRGRKLNACNASILNRRLWMVFVDLHCRCARRAMCSKHCGPGNGFESSRGSSGRVLIRRLGVTVQLDGTRHPAPLNDRLITFVVGFSSIRL